MKCTSISRVLFNKCGSQNKNMTKEVKIVLRKSAHDIDLFWGGRGGNKFSLQPLRMHLY